MRRSVVIAGLVSVGISVAALAGDQLAFDGMGAMMLEHEAEEIQAKETSADIVTGKCANEERAHQARVLEMNEAFSQNFAEMSAQMSIRVPAVDMAALERTAALTAKRVADMREHKLVVLEVARRSLAEHRDELEQYRFAFNDPKLLAKVQDALETAEKVLADD